jgi:polyisoprenoid-binding protein YceI
MAAAIAAVAMMIPNSVYRMLIAPLFLSTSAAVANPPTLYVFDPVETHSRFEAKFLGFITVRGKFNRTTGTLHHDAENTDATGRLDDKIHAVIDTTTLDAHVVNAHATNKILRGPEFFNVEKFPTIEFKSKQFRYEGEKVTHIDGTLKVVGTTRPVTLIVENSGCTPASPNVQARCVADASVVIKRSEFGMKAWSASISDEVKIIVEMVAVAPAPTSDAKPAKVAAPETTSDAAAISVTPKQGN